MHELGIIVSISGEKVTAKPMRRDAAVRELAAARAGDMPAGVDIMELFTQPGFAERMVAVAAVKPAKKPATKAKKKADPKPDPVADDVAAG